MIDKQFRGVVRQFHLGFWLSDDPTKWIDCVENQNHRSYKWEISAIATFRRYSEIQSLLQSRKEK